MRGYFYSSTIVLHNFSSQPFFFFFLRINPGIIKLGRKISNNKIFLNNNSSGIDSIQTIKRKENLTLLTKTSYVTKIIVRKV